MSENDTRNSGGIEGFSADYRNAHPPKPKAERPAPKKTASKQTAPKQNVSKQSARKNTAKKTSSTKPKAEKKHVATPLPEASMENENELDDFLPEGEKSGVESYLTKWDEGEKPPVTHTDRQRRRSGKYRYGLFTGFLVLLLALVGVGFLAVTVGQRIHSALTDDSRLRAYDKQIAVVVAQDPQPFESPDKADAEFVLDVSIWKLMMEHSSDYTAYDDIGRTVVPLGDVVDACEELFGPDCALHPKSPETESFYTYDSAKAQFHIALYSQEGVYTPYTVSAKKEGDGVVLRVGYIPPTDPTRTSSVNSGTEKPSPAKYMDYVIKTDEKTKKDYVFAVRKAS
jgi:hypothetical protein